MCLWMNNLVRQKKYLKLKSDTTKEPTHGGFFSFKLAFSHIDIYLPPSSNRGWVYYIGD